MTTPALTRSARGSSEAFVSPLGIPETGTGVVRASTIALDVVVLGLATLFAVLVDRLAGADEVHSRLSLLLAVSVVCIGGVGVLAVSGRYGTISHRRAAPFLPTAFALTVFVFVISLVGSAESGAFHFSEREAAVLWLTALVGIALSSTFVRTTVLPRMVRPQRTLIVGAGEVGQNLARKMRGDSRVHVIGFVDNDPPPIDQSVGEIPLLGSENELVELARIHRADRLVIGFSRVPAESIVEAIRSHGLHQLDISIVPRYFDITPAGASLDDVNGVPVLELSAGRLSKGAVMVKRTLDLMFTVVLMPVLVPLMAVIALAIKIDSRGPVFFKQKRMGRGDREFSIIKFRTMAVDAENRRSELLDQNEATGPLFKLKSDPRVTRIGGFLRKTSLDELPQLINVLKGEMSLVGPRPFVTYEDAEITGWARQRLDVTPGLTGIWQVMGRSDMSFDEMLRLDHLYVTRWSLGWDIKILLKTIPAVLGRKGAY